MNKSLSPGLNRINYGDLELAQVYFIKSTSFVWSNMVFEDIY